MHRKLQTHRKIQGAKKSKGIFGDHPPFLAGDLIQYHTEIEKLKDSRSFNSEYIRWNLVALVSILESFYKGLFAKYIDSGEPYMTRAKKLISSNLSELSLEAVIEITKKTYSIGELIAYSLKYHTLQSIRHSFEILCDCDYVEKLKGTDLVLDTYDNLEFNRAKSSIEKIFSLLDTAYFKRNALVHEYPAVSVVVTIDELLKYFDSAWLLAMASDRIFWAETQSSNPYPYDIHGRMPQNKRN